MILHKIFKPPYHVSQDTSCRFFSVINCSVIWTPCKTSVLLTYQQKQLTWRKIVPLVVMNGFLMIFWSRQLLIYLIFWHWPQSDRLLTGCLNENSDLWPQDIDSLTMSFADPVLRQYIWIDWIKKTASHLCLDIFD